MQKCIANRGCAGGRRVVLFHGGMTRAEKEQAMADMNSDKAIIALTTLDIAGVGLNLVKFSIVVLTDRCYNPQVITTKPKNNLTSTY
jgi:RecG-like helicase